MDQCHERHHHQVIAIAGLLSLARFSQSPLTTQSANREKYLRFALHKVWAL
jgi:hypothetical protein